MGDSEQKFGEFSLLLRQLYKGEEALPKRLIRKFTEYASKEDSSGNRRKIQNWLKDKNFPQSREELFKICFALELDEKRAEVLLGMTEESGIHLRNPRELVYAFCLRMGVDYPQALEMLQRLWKEPFPITEMDYHKYKRKNNTTENTGFMTGSIRNEFYELRTEQQLRAFLEKNRERFGVYHNTAYRKFRKLLDMLISPQIPDMPKEQKYSIRCMVEEYLRMGVPYDKKTADYSELQKIIKKQWPSAKSIYEMYNRREDVNRKTLLLLYVATGGVDAEETSAGHRIKMDLMLTECGFPILNEKNPFDHLILRAIGDEREEEFLSSNLEVLLKKIFRTASGSEPYCKEMEEG